MSDNVAAEAAEVVQDFNESAEAEVSASSLAGAIVDGEIDAGLFDGVQTLGDLIPKNSKLKFELRSFKEGTSKPWLGEKGDPTLEYLGEQPYFNCTFVCQQEPFTGKRVYDFIHFINKKTQAAAANGDATAISVKNKRLVRLKALLKGASYSPTGVFDIRKFLEAKPAVGIEVGEGKKQDGTPQNTIINYFPIAG